MKGSSSPVPWNPSSRKGPSKGTVDTPRSRPSRRPLVQAALPRAWDGYPQTPVGFPLKRQVFPPLTQEPGPTLLCDKGQFPARILPDPQQH